MKKDKTYFALWADDINKYLSTCYNCDSLSEIKKGIIEYISVDQDNLIENNNFSILTLLKMTGLELDYNPIKFDYNDIFDDEPALLRTGEKVQECYLV